MRVLAKESIAWERPPQGTDSISYLEEEHKTWETGLPYHSVRRDYLRNVRQIGVGHGSLGR